MRSDEILELSIKYVIARTKGNQYKYPEGWDKNMKRSVRKRADKMTRTSVLHAPNGTTKVACCLYY